MRRLPTTDDAMTIGWLDEMPWEVILATQPVYLRGLPVPSSVSRRFGVRLRERFG